MWNIASGLPQLCQSLKRMVHSESAGIIRSLNGALQVDQYPLPHLSDLFTCLKTLTGGTKFTKLDLSVAGSDYETSFEVRTESGSVTGDLSC